jgi:putative transposase
LESELKREGRRRLNISRVLRILGVSRSGYNSFKKREFNTKKPSRKDELKALILDVYLKSKQIYGAPKITKELKKRGIKVAEKTVGNYMRQMKIKAHYVKPYVKTTIAPDFDNRLKNLLNEQFNPEKPNAVWCTDITYIHTEKGFVYLTSIMDLFSRRIIAWRLSETLEAKWVVECVLEAKELRRTVQPLVLHSDRGSQYVCGTYIEALNNIMPSYSKKASPWQNACIESFHALIKREWLYCFKIKDFNHAYRLVFEYIETFYNTVRSHSHCGYLSPQEHEEYYYAQLKNSLAKAG